MSVAAERDGKDEEGNSGYFSYIRRCKRSVFSDESEVMKIARNEKRETGRKTKEGKQTDTKD